jgi:hypothetical protein
MKNQNQNKSATTNNRSKIAQLAITIAILALIIFVPLLKGYIPYSPYELIILLTLLSMNILHIQDKI